jgi:hypothetical protein
MRRSAFLPPRLILQSIFDSFAILYNYKPREKDIIACQRIFAEEFLHVKEIKPIRSRISF